MLRAAEEEIRRILTELEIDDVDWSELQRAWDAAAPRVQHLVGARLMAELSDEQVERFDRLERLGDEDGARRFLADELPNYREITEAALRVAARHLIRGYLRLRSDGGSR